MPVPSRIKIIQVNNLEEVESKVNDFLAFDKNIAHLVNIDYRLESNFVIIEYFVRSKQIEEEKNRDYNISPITYWWELCFPFLPNSF
jgi:hypothetical protein